VRRGSGEPMQHAPRPQTCRSVRWMPSGRADSSYLRVFVEHVPHGVPHGVVLVLQRERLLVHRHGGTVGVGGGDGAVLSGRRRRRSKVCEVRLPSARVSSTPPPRRITRFRVGSGFRVWGHRQEHTRIGQARHPRPDHIARAAAPRCQRQVPSSQYIVCVCVTLCVLDRPSPDT